MVVMVMIAMIDPIVHTGEDYNVVYDVIVDDNVEVIRMNYFPYLFVEIYLYILYINLFVFNQDGGSSL